MAGGYKYELTSTLEDGELGAVSAKPKQYCKRNRRLKVLVLLLLAVTAVLIGLLQWRWNFREPEVCLSPDCVDVSAYIRSKMNLSADPCKDFYNYACGGWEKNTFVPPERAKFDRFVEVNTNNMAIIKKLLDQKNALLKGRYSSAVDKVKKYYRTCMDEEKIESAGTGPILKMIDELGSWSVVSRYIQSNWSLESVLIQLNKLDTSPLFVFTLGVDKKNSSRYVLTFSQGGLTLDSREEYGNNSEKYHLAFLKFAESVGKLLGGDNSTRQKMEAVYQLEKRLAASFMPKEELMDPQNVYNMMTLTEFQDVLGSKLNISHFIAGVVDRTFAPSSKVLVTTRDYFPRLQKVLSETDPQVVQDYLVWYLVQGIPGYLPQSFVNAAMEISKVELGISTLSQRWKRCISKVESAFGFAVSALYVDATFSPESRTQALEIVSAVRSAFIANLDNVAWMDENTHQTAKTKAQTARIKLGYPDWILDVSQLDEYYEMVEVTEGAFLDSFFSASQADARRTWSLLETAPDPDLWSLSPHEVNAFFSPTYNQLVILAGLLQRPFFDSAYPLSFAYGSTGSISGHELSHGFDNTGRKYDQHGNLNDWWSQSSSHAFKEHAQCLVQEYSHFSVYGKQINGEYTLDENIADNGGLKLGYAAYTSQRNAHPEVKLPGLLLTSEQLYFLGFAQMWCAYYTPEYAVHSILTDEHTLSRFRVLGSVANSPAFAEAFGCPADSPLNPVQKCQVW